MKIGVVIPTHPARMLNGMTTRAIHSALTQTLRPTALNVHCDTEGRGVPYCRQKALEANQEEWTAFLDSDDWFMRHHLERLVAAQEESGADYVYSWYQLVVLGRPRKHVVGEHDGVFPYGHFADPWDPENPRQTTITMLVRTELAKEIGFWAPTDETTFPDGHRVGEDYHFTLECNRLGTIFHLPERTWFWEHHGLNTSGRHGQGDAQ